jgi:NhaA family Na+:H+ antiporter
MVHESGVHATIAGVVLGLLVRVKPDVDEDHSPAEDLEHRLRPWSAGVAVPVFAFISAGVAIDGESLRAMATSPIGQGIVVGLVVGKFVGVLGGAYLVARLTRAELSEDLSWTDVAGVGLVSGIGFTVSLLIADLAFEEDAASLDIAKAGILAGSVLSALLAAGLLRMRDAHYRNLDASGGADDVDAGTDPGAGRQPGPPSGMI